MKKNIITSEFIGKFYSFSTEKKTANLRAEKRKPGKITSRYVVDWQLSE